MNAKVRLTRDSHFLSSTAGVVERQDQPRYLIPHRRRADGKALTLTQLLVGVPESMVVGSVITAVRTRPPGLAGTAILMSACNVSGFVFIDWMSPRLALDLIVFAAIMSISAIVIRFYWHGRNWARLLVLFTSLIAISNLAYFFEFGLLAKALILVEAVLGVFLLYWLNTHLVRAYFSRPR